MADDPRLSEVGLLLIRTPESSRKILADAAQGHEPPGQPDAEFPVDSARSWCMSILQEAYRPPPAARFVAFPLEREVCDVIRLRHSARNKNIEIAQSKYLISIRIDGIRGVDIDQELTRAEQIAKEVFTLSERIRFRRLGAYGKGAFGEQDTSQAGFVDRECGHWLDSLLWWQEGEQLGFLVLKATGGPTRHRPSPTVEDNRTWF